MLFSTKNNKHHVKSFFLKVSSDAQDKPVAYGPGSVVNGSVVIQVSKPQTVKKLKVVFQCAEHCSKQSTIIFSVESILLDTELPSQVSELNPGNHMYLFAIKLPDVNYPPTLGNNDIDYKVNYTLQGFLDVANPFQEIETQKVHIMYLPLVTCRPTSSPIIRRKVYHEVEQRVQVEAELVRPDFCPGNMCTIKMITQNRSDFRIAHVDLAFISTTASDMFCSNSQGFRRNQTLYSEKFYTAINTHADDQHTLLQFRIPASCPPSIQTHRHIDISYQIMITVPLYYTPSLSSTSGPASSSTVSSLMISLPVTIATVPYTFPQPPQLHIPLPSYQASQDNEFASDIPRFLNQHITDSPLPSPCSAYSVEGTGSWSDPDRGSPLMEDQAMVDWPLIPALNLGSAISPSTHTTSHMASHQDESGHLMVPRVTSTSCVITTDVNHTDRRRRSVSSIVSCSDILTNECSLKVT